MNLADTIKLVEASAIAPTHSHHAVMSPHMKQTGGHTHSEVKKEHVGHSGGGHGSSHRGVRKSGLHHIKPGGKGLSIKHPHVHLVHPNFNKANKMAVRADASASDLASHHTYEEPSASDQTIRDWRFKRAVEKVRGRNLDPFEEVQAATGPCGCTLKLGEKVMVEGIGRGEIKSRQDRMLRISLDNGKSRVVDQKFVHRMASARR